MLRKKRGRIEWFEFEQLSGLKGICHGVFLRRGGVSEAPFDSLNVAESVGDAAERVYENQFLIQQVLGCSSLQGAQQCHGPRVICLPRESEKLISGCDGLITDQKGVGLMIKHADCQAVILYDPVKHVIANVHAGWKGNVCNIFAHAVVRLQKEYGVEAQDLLACISPSLGPCCSEFIHYEKELPQEFWSFDVGKKHFDLWRISRWQLENLGIKKDKIEVAGICTRCHGEDFFSYRRDKVTGRNGTVVCFSDKC